MSMDILYYIAAAYMLCVVIHTVAIGHKPRLKPRSAADYAETVIMGFLIIWLLIEATR